MMRGKPQVVRVKKLAQKMNSRDCTILLTKKLTRVIFLWAPATNMPCTSRFLIGCMIWVVCYLRSQLDHSFPSRLADGTPHSSSYMLSSSLLLPFTWTTCSKSSSFSPFYSPGQIYCKSNFALIFALSGLKILRPTSTYQKYSETIPFSVLAANSFKIHENFLSPTLFLTYENFVSLLTCSILLLLESKKFVLTPASALECTDSVDELRFRSRSEF